MLLKTIEKRDEKYRKNIPEEIISDIENNLIEYTNKLDLFFQKYLREINKNFNYFKIPTIKFCKEGGTAGVAMYKHYILGLNPEYLNNEKNINEMKLDTTVHELCHFYIHYLEKERFFMYYDINEQNAIYKLEKPLTKFKYCKGHGKEWKYLMDFICEINSDRCHDMLRDNETKSKKRGKLKRDYYYECPSCGNKFKFTSIRHNRYQKYYEKHDKAYYSCGKCKEGLIWNIDIY